MLICRLCNKEFQQITNKHLQAKHQMSCKDYLLKFPGELLVDPEISIKKGQAVSKAKAGNTVAWNKGRKMSDQQREMLSKIVTDKYASGEKIHWNTGNKWSEDIKNKISNTLIGRSFWSDETQQKRNLTIKQKLLDGWVSPLKGRALSEETKQKISQKLRTIIQNKSIKSFERIQKLCIENNLQIISIDQNYYLNLKCNQCTTTFSNTRQVFNISKNNGEKLCPTCFPKDKIVSNMEIELRDIVKNLYNDEIIFNDREILKGKEIDILFPKLKIGIEFNGLYWHSTDETKIDYHILHKQQFAYKEGISLITIFENELIYKKDIVKSRIRNILGKSNKIFARKCIIKEVSYLDSKLFLQDNHIQGNCNSSIRYGLYFNNELVSLITFGKSRFDKNIQFELLRYCNILNTSVVGGASKLFKYFIKNNNPKSIISYSDCRWNTGKLYKTLGFLYDGKSKPNYYYVKQNDNNLYSRYDFQKHKLSNRLQMYDKNLSEIENMINNNYRIIYDCGNAKWLWQKP